MFIQRSLKVQGYLTYKKTHLPLVPTVQCNPMLRVLEGSLVGWAYPTDFIVSFICFITHTRLSIHRTARECAEDERDLEFGVQGLGFRVWGLKSGVRG